jgi:hypothetical protein
LGHTGAHEWLGAMYDYGLGTRPNRRVALAHYKIAADARRPNAEYHVGVFYLEGRGVPKDYGWLFNGFARLRHTAIPRLFMCWGTAILTGVELY